jgi:hypothetical protein
MRLWGTRLIVIGAIAALSFSPVVATSASSSGLNCLQSASALLGGRDLSQVQGLDYFIQKIPEIRYLGWDNMTAVILRLKLHLYSEGLSKQFVPLKDIRQIHAIGERPTSVLKTQARVEKLKNYFSSKGVPKVITEKIQDEVTKSISPILAVKTDEGTYMVLDGNGRISALTSVLGQESDVKLEISVYDIEYSKIKYLVELRRIPGHFRDSPIQAIRDKLMMTEITEAQIDDSIGVLQGLIGDAQTKLAANPSEKQKMGLLRRSDLLIEYKRALENVKLWRKRELGDFYRAGFNDEQLVWMVKKQAPLGFTPNEWSELRRDLGHVLKEEKLEDATCMIDGSSTTFYSNNPTKGLGHHFGDTLISKSDYDIKLFSPTLMKRLKAKGVQPKRNSPYVYFRAKLEQEIPALKEFNERWSARKGRSVSIIGIDAESISSEEGNGAFMFSIEDLLSSWSREEQKQLLAA